MKCYSQRNEEGLPYQMYPKQALDTCMHAHALCIKLMWERSFPGFDTRGHM